MMLKKWLTFIEELVKEWPEDSINKTWIKLYDKELLIEDEATIEIFRICKYQNINLKMTQLEAQYLDKQSLACATLEFNHKSLNSLTAGLQVVSLIGEAKKGSASNRKHCLKDVAIDYPEKVATLNFRASDLLKKFLTDIYFVQQKVLAPLGAKNFPLVCKFDSIMLRSPFWFIYLDQYGDLYGEKALREKIEKKDAITKSWLRFYSKHQNLDINYKSLDRCRDRMEESYWWPVYSEYINRYKSI